MTTFTDNFEDDFLKTIKELKKIQQTASEEQQDIINDIIEIAKESWEEKDSIHIYQSLLEMEDIIEKMDEHKAGE